MRESDADYRKILAEARRQGIEPRVENHEGQPLFATMQVKLYVNPSARTYKSVQINDKTYSRTVVHIEQGIEK
jgi:aspartate carbamoyltransferase catalytic subunit